MWIAGSWPTTLRTIGRHEMLQQPSGLQVGFLFCLGITPCSSQSVCTTSYSLWKGH